MAGPKKARATTRAENGTIASATEPDEDPNPLDVPPPRYESIIKMSDNGENTPTPSVADTNADAVIELRGVTPLPSQQPAPAPAMQVVVATTLHHQAAQQQPGEGAGANPAAAGGAKKRWVDELFRVCCDSGINFGDVHIRGPYLVLPLLAVVAVIFLVVWGVRGF